MKQLILIAVLESDIPPDWIKLGNVNLEVTDGEHVWKPDVISVNAVEAEQPKPAVGHGAGLGKAMSQSAFSQAVSSMSGFGNRGMGMGM
jgi:hypothetical protein